MPRRYSMPRRSACPATERFSNAMSSVVKWSTSFVGDRGAKSFVVTLADLNDIQVELDISQNDFNRIAPHQPCTVVTDAYPDRPYECRVDEISPEANRQKATLQAKVEFLKRHD